MIVAVNHDPDSAELPHWWQGQGALTHIERWRNFGLTDDQIAACAAETRKGNPEPPDGPRALDKAMQRLADSLAKRAGKAPVLTPEQAEAQRLENLRRFQRWVRERSGLALTINLDQADQLLTAAMVTPADLTAAGTRFRTGPGSVSARLFPDRRP